MQNCEKCDEEAIAMTTICYGDKPLNEIHFYMFTEINAIENVLNEKSDEYKEYFLCERHLFERINIIEMLHKLGSPKSYTKCTFCIDRINLLKGGPNDKHRTMRPMCQESSLLNQKD